MGEIRFGHKWYDNHHMQRLREFLWPLTLTFLVFVLVMVTRSSILLFMDSLFWGYCIAFGIVITGAWCVMRIWQGFRTDVPTSISIGQKILIVYGILLCVRTVILYLNYGQFIDLSYYESAVSQMASFSLPRIWDIGSPLWSQHFEPILLLFVPFYWLGFGGSMLLVLGQATLAVAGGFVCYRIALLRTQKKDIAVGLSALYLAFGGLQSAYMYGFHPIALFPFFFLIANWFYERKLFGWYAIFVFLSLCVKEGISFVVIFWGVWVILGRRDWRRGILTAIGGVVWYFISFGIISQFHHGGYEYWGQFGGGSGGGVLGIMAFALSHPVQFVSQFFDDPRKLPTLIEMFGSFGFLPFLAPLSLVMLIPSLLLKLLSHDISMLNSFHYSAEITPLLTLSALEGIRVLLRRGRFAHLGIYLFSSAVLSNIFYGFAFYYRTYAFRFGENGPGDFLRTAHSRAVDRLVQTIPEEASVSCEYAICSHIGRSLGSKLPIPHKDTLEYVLLDPKNPSVLTEEETYKKFVEERIFPNYELIVTGDGAMLLRRFAKYTNQITK